MADDRTKGPPRRVQKMLGGQVLYDSERPISDEERGRRIKLALRNVGWKREGEDRPPPRRDALAPQDPGRQPPTRPGKIVSGELLPAGPGLPSVFGGRGTGALGSSSSSFRP